MARGQLWAVTSFFNPAGYRRLLANYRRFHDALQVPLAAAELSFDGRWELDGHDADILVRITDGDVLWQKERLLNLLIEQLPAECEYIAWIDADVLFLDPSWPQRTLNELASAPLVQLFTTVRHLGHDGTVPPASLPSAAAVALEGQSPFRPKIKHGMAWAARRELLSRNGLYDSCVMGCGDTALLGAAYGVPEIVMSEKQMSPAQQDHYSQWATGFYSDVDGRVGAVDGEIHHLWHGDLADRRYDLREKDLAPHCFDPLTDLRLGAEGAWRWATAKPAMHALLREYFYGRSDDGKTAHPVERSLRS